MATLSTAATASATSSAPPPATAIIDQSTVQSMTTLVSYPTLLTHEEALTKSPHDVTLWYHYLTEIDDILSTLRSSSSSSSSAQKKFKPFTVGGGRSISTSSEIPTLIKQLSRARISVGERALSLLPGSYKLWKTHLNFRTSLFNNNNYPTQCSKWQRRYRATKSAFERSLVRMNKFPRVWLMYVKFVEKYDAEVTNVRRLYDRALLALPATQHEKIWPDYLSWATGETAAGGAAGGAITSASASPGTSADGNEEEGRIIPAETTLRILRRYARYYNPAYRQSLSQTCFRLNRYGECASLLVDILNDTTFLSPEGTTRHELWMTLCDVCTHHPDEIRDAGVDFDAIVRAALAGSGEEEDENKLQFGEMEGTLRTKLADYYVRGGQFEMARSVYEEALEHVCRVRDFSVVFDSYGKFEEGSISAQIALMEEEEGEGEEQEEEKEGGGSGVDPDEEDMQILLDQSGGTDNVGGGTSAIELEMARAEHLMERRPLLLNRVLLRQNPHNVGEWLRRSELYQKMDNGQEEAITALEEGCRAVKAQHAVNGNPATLWTTLAKLHEDRNDVGKAREVYRRVCVERCYRFKTVDDLAQVWSEWAEFELRVEAYDEALSVVRQAVATPSDYQHRGQQRAGGNKSKGGRAQGGLYRSLRMWNLALDLEESLGGLANAKAAYARCVELGVATPQIILNYATFLSENKYHEESFTAYEKGVALFPFPHPGATQIWSAYLKAFTNRYDGTKVERARELFERCVEHCPPDKSSEFYLMYAKFEETYGLAKRGLGVYERLCKAVPTEEKLKAYQLYITKAESYSGASKTRPIYEAAIAALEDRDAAAMCLQYSDLETKLGEIDRARTALTYGAQMADPRRDPEYWKRFHAFEVSHGNEDTFREMLRVKRGVAAAFSTVNYNAAEMGAAEPAGRPKNLTEDEALEMIAKREGVKHKNLPTIGGFVTGKRTAAEADLEVLERQAARLRQATATTAGGGGGGRGTAADGGGGADDSGEIDIEEEEGDEGHGGSGGDAAKQSNTVVQDVTTKAVPAAVFGGLGGDADADADAGGKKGASSTMGALERLKAASSAKGSE